MTINPISKFFLIDIILSKRLQQKTKADSKICKFISKVGGKKLKYLARFYYKKKLSYKNVLGLERCLTIFLKAQRVLEKKMF